MGYPNGAYAVRTMDSRTFLTQIPEFYGCDSILPVTESIYLGQFQITLSLHNIDVNCQWRALRDSNPRHAD